MVAALPDPPQDNAGERFAQAGVQYDVGCCADIAEHIHGGFLARVTRPYPRITGKWAVSANGSIGQQNDSGQARPTAISSPVARAASRRRRRAFDAICVGAGTVFADDPQLLAGSGRHPARVVIGNRFSWLPGSRLLATVQHADIHIITNNSMIIDEVAQLALAEELSDKIHIHQVANCHDPVQVAEVFFCLQMERCIGRGRSSRARRMVSCR